MQQPTTPEPAGARPEVIAAYVAAGLLLFGFGAYLGVARPSPSSDALPPGVTAPPSPSPSAAPADDLLLLAPALRFAELEGLNGGTFRLEDYRAGVVVVVLFSAASPGSLEPLSLLAELDQEFPGGPVEFLALSIDDAESDRDEVARIAAGLEMPESFAFVPFDVARSLSPADERGVSVPQILILAPGGRVAHHQVGFAPGADLSAVRERVRRLLSSPGSLQ